LAPSTSSDTLKIEECILRSARQRAGNVVARTELAGMGSASQASQALKSLQAKGVLIRIGTGVYAKTRRSSVTGATVPAGSLETLATEALKKLGVAVRAGKAAAAYNSGKTTQLPGSFVVDTGARRISRTIEVGGRTLVYENDSRAKSAAKALHDDSCDHVPVLRSRRYAKNGTLKCAAPALLHICHKNSRLAGAVFHRHRPRTSKATRAAVSEEKLTFRGTLTHVLRSSYSRSLLAAHLSPQRTF
jgi:hypothetical protein